MPPDPRPDRLWDWLAKHYDRGAHENDLLDQAADAIAARLAPDATVLDFACGTGALSFKLAGRVGTVHGIDTSSRMIELARENARVRGAGNVRFTACSLFDASLEPAGYDALLAFNILHLVGDPGEILRRAAELVRPGGHLATEVPCMGEGNAFHRRVLPLVTRLGLLSHIEPLTLAEVEEAVAAAGFTRVAGELREGSVPSLFLLAERT